MLVRELCNRDVIVVAGHASVIEAAKLMREFHVGSLIVVETDGEDKRPVGILTDRDIVIEIVAAELDPEAIMVGDAMSDELVTVSEQSGLLETIELMRQRGVRRIPVVDDEGRLVGLMASDDALEVIAEQLDDLVRLSGWQQRREVARRPTSELSR